MSSNASAHAREHGTTIATVRTAEKALEVIQESRPQVLLVDLQTPGLEITTLGEAIQKLADSVAPVTIGYAQHVNVEILESAKSAGFDQVLTRGQVNREIGQIVAEAV